MVDLGQPVAAQHPAWKLSRGARLDRPIRRIVSLLPSATEIVAALGLSDRLVGVTHECDFPPELVARLPRLTADRIAYPRAGDRPLRSGEIDAAVRTALADGHGLYRLDQVLLDALQPDLILTQELCSVCAAAYPQVRAAARLIGGSGEPLVVSLEPRTLDDVFATIRLVADLADVSSAGEALVAQLRRRIAAARAQGASGSRRRVALVEWLEPLFAPGHWVPDQISAAGGVPVIGRRGERSREVAWSDLAAAEPDRIVLGLCGFDLPRTLGEWEAFDPPDAVRSTRAWRSGQVWAIDGSAVVSRPGPRLVDGVEILGAVLCGTPTARAIRVPTHRTSRVGLGA